MTAKFNFVVAAFFVLPLALAAPRPATANTIYTYTGNTFTDFIDATPPADTFTSLMSVSGSFTLANPLATGLLHADITASVLNFSFSDGRGTIDTSITLQTKAFTVWTDGAGNITDWIIQLEQSFLPPHVGDQTIAIRTLTGLDAGFLSECIGEAQGTCNLVKFDRGLALDNPGTWSSRDTVGVPGPVAGAGLPGLMMACGGLLVWYRRRKSAQQV